MERREKREWFCRLLFPLPYCLHPVVYGPPQYYIQHLVLSLTLILSLCFSSSWLYSLVYNTLFFVRSSFEMVFLFLVHGMIANEVEI